MSGKKIKAKDLSYQAPLPPFLQALHAQVGGTDQPSVSGPKRAVKKRSGSEEAEDVPLVVDEEGNVVSVEVDKEGTVKSSAQAEEDDGDDKELGKEDQSNKATFGGRKRKVGKIIGDAAEQDSTKQSSKGKDDKASSGAKEDGEKSKDKKPKKKAKKIKLSFDEEDG